MKIAPIYSAEHIAALVRHWIERGEPAQEIETALRDKINEAYRGLEQHWGAAQAERV